MGRNEDDRHSHTHIRLINGMYDNQEEKARTRHGKYECFKTEKIVRQGCTNVPQLFNIYSESTTRALDEITGNKE